MTKLIPKWRKDADQYQRQVEEARSKRIPHDQTLSLMTQLRICAFELEAALRKKSE